MKFVVDHMPIGYNNCPYIKKETYNEDLESYRCKLDNDFCNLDVEESEYLIGSVVHKYFKIREGCTNCRWLMELNLNY